MSAAVLRLYTPRGAWIMQGDVYEDNMPSIAAALDRELPALGEHYGRCGAVIERDGISYIIKSARRTA